jgi:N utilization substance protein B
MAIQLLYQPDLGGSTLPQVFHHFDLGAYLAAEDDEPAPAKEKAGRAEDPEKARRRAHEAFEHARVLVEGAAAHREEIDALIRGQADNWRLERMPAVDRNILRLAVYELLHQPDVPKLVVLDEAIELAKKYGSEQSGRFINGLLDGLLKQRAGEGGK